MDTDWKKKSRAQNWRRSTFFFFQNVTVDEQVAEESRKPCCEGDRRLEADNETETQKVSQRSQTHSQWSLSCWDEGHGKSYLRKKATKNVFSWIVQKCVNKAIFPIQRKHAMPYVNNSYNNLFLPYVVRISIMAMAILFLCLRIQATLYL